jgi:hypothetical protein
MPSGPSIQQRAQRILSRRALAMQNQAETQRFASLHAPPLPDGISPELAKLIFRR